ncbi:MAG: ABC-F family ATP-binding cassette domain-containing protein [Chloroflexia bacterium]
MILVNMDSVAKYYGTHLIFDNLSWQIDEHEKIGLVGPNGAGKSTLLRLLAGADVADSGQVAARRGLKVALLSQEVPAPPGSTPLSVALGGSADLHALITAIERAEAAFADPDVYGDMDKLNAVSEEHARLLDEYESVGAGRLRSQATGLLNLMGFSAEELEEPLSTMSGGQKKLAYLAGCLLSEPDLLLLDEPDNHLDLEGKARLEAIVRDFAGSVVIISHDRYLLDETVNEIAEMDGGRLRTYVGNYSSYAVQKELALVKQQADYVAQQKEIQRLEEAVARFKDWASRVIDERHIKQARNKQRQIDRMEKVERPVMERRKIRLQLHPHQRGGQKVVELRSVSKSFSDNGHGPVEVLRRLNGLVRHGERVGLVGPNGSGKSVLFRLISGQAAPTSGEVWVGPSIQLGLYTQEHQSLDLHSTPVDTVRRVKPMYEEQAYGFLGRFLFSYEKARRPIRTLSGGEKARLQLACLMLTGANCLLLDEPTNNLDIESAEVLENALADYKGTVIVISHDRYFLDRVVDRIWELKDGKLREFEGAWSEYRERA